jgi:SAM-dependent methyltransferase
MSGTVGFNGFAVWITERSVRGAGSLNSAQPELSVQYGCGFDAPEDWLNFDSSPTLRLERLPIVGALFSKNASRFPKGVQYGNIVSGLPLEPNSVSRLYASHVLEHLPKVDAIKALRNSFRILRPGGTFRLIVPDLFSRATHYIQASNGLDPTAADHFMLSSGLGTEREATGLVDRISQTFGSSRHLWMWDEPAMTKALRDIGFTDIRRCSFGDSGDTNFGTVENATRFVNGSIVELAVECKKPSQ